ncbi:MAG TPA: hypothetical protein V6C98_16455 [Thermosynechococcaceae cyanobacterium]
MPTTPSRSLIGQGYSTLEAEVCSLFHTYAVYRIVKRCFWRANRSGAIDAIGVASTARFVSQLL